jgi:hypothetical protein
VRRGQQCNNAKGGTHPLLAHNYGTADLAPMHQLSDVLLEQQPRPAEAGSTVDAVSARF